MSLSSPWRAGALALLAALAASSAARAQENLPDPFLTPRLVHYAMKCHSPGKCRIDCFQGGNAVVSRLNLGEKDRITLVVNAGISDLIKPRWIEIVPARDSGVETILLTDDTLCDFHSLTIEAAPTE